MRFALVLAAALVAGCGDDTTTLPVSMDMAAPIIDLSMPGLACGVSTCSGACAACAHVLAGVCAPPCNSASPSCAAGTTCRPAGGPVDAAGLDVTFAGNCAGYDGVCL